MKKFIKKLFLIGIIILLLTSVINSTYMYAVEVRDEDDLAKYKMIPQEIQLCNLGSSHGQKSFCYEGIDEFVCFNFALSAQSLSYDYRILKTYKENLQEGCVVIIPISYFSFFGEAEEEMVGFESKNRRYYQILPDDKIKKYEYRQSILEKYFPALIAYENVFLDIAAVAEGNVTKKNWEQTIKTEDAIEQAEKAYDQHIVKFFDNNDKYIINQEEIQALRDIISLCNEESFVPVLVTTPFLNENENVIKKKSPDFKEVFLRIIKENANSVSYYDYSTDSRFAYNYDMFSDVTHLNKEGAKHFTKIFLQEVLFDIID